MPTDVAGQAKRLSAAVWLWLLPSGAFAIALGLVSILWPHVTVALLGLVFGLWLTVTGLVRVGLAGAMRNWPQWRRAATAAFGGVLVLAGIAGVFGLIASERLLATVIGIGFLFSAAADLMIGLSGRRARGRAAVLALAGVNAVVGVIFLARPGAGLTFIAVAIGLVLVALGIAQLVAALMLRRSLHRFIDSAANRSIGHGEPREISVEIL